MRERIGKIIRDDAVVNLTRITVRPENRRELSQTISSLIEPLKNERGCLGYHIYKEADDENTFVLIGEWETPEAWNTHLISDNFAVLFGSISLLCNPSHVDFKLLSRNSGVEAVTRTRIRT